MIYVITSKSMGGGNNIACCSHDKLKLEAEIERRNYPVKVEITTRQFDFDIQGLKEIYTIEGDLNNTDNFVDIGKYFEDYNEAFLEESKLNSYEEKRKYSLRRISVIY